MAAGHSSTTFNELPEEFDAALKEARRAALDTGARWSPSFFAVIAGGRTPDRVRAARTQRLAATAIRADYFGRCSCAFGGLMYKGISSELRSNLPIWMVPSTINNTNNFIVLLLKAKRGDRLGRPASNLVVARCLDCFPTAA